MKYKEGEEMFGINGLLVLIFSWLFKFWKITVIGAVIVAVVFCIAGCASPADVVKGSENKVSEATTEQDQIAALIKNDTDASSDDHSKDDHSDNTINFEVADKPTNQKLEETVFQPVEIPALPPVADRLDDRKVEKIVEAQIKEREIALRTDNAKSQAMILAEAKSRESRLLEKVAAIQTTNAEEVAKVVEARAKERELIIKAEADAEVLKIRAEKEQWRIWTYAGGVCAILIIMGIIACVSMYLKQSPWDKTRKAK